MLLYSLVFNVYMKLHNTYTVKKLFNIVKVFFKFIHCIDFMNIVYIESPLDSIYEYYLNNFILNQNLYQWGIDK